MLKCNHASYHVHSTCSKAMCLVVSIYIFIPYNNEVLQSDWSIAGVIFTSNIFECESSAYIIFTYNSCEFIASLMVSAVQYKTVTVLQWDILAKYTTLWASQNLCISINTKMNARLWHEISKATCTEQPQVSSFKQHAFKDHCRFTCFSTLVGLCYYGSLLKCGAEALHCAT